MKDILSIALAKKLHPAISSLVMNGIDEAEHIMGPAYAVRIVQATRTIAFQNALYNQPHDHIDNDHDGKTDEADEKVTNAKGGSSYHNYGLAFDFCILFLDAASGKYIFHPVRSWKINSVWMTVIEVFKKRGFTWGADWDNDGITKAQGDKDEHLVDAPHLQKTFQYHWLDLLAKYNRKDFIPGTSFVKL